MLDIEYFRRRERQERDQASRSGDDVVRTIHVALADRYAALGELDAPAIPLPPRA